MYSVDLVIELVAPFVASKTMDIGLWIPFSIGIGSLLLCYPVLFFMQSEQPQVGEDATAVPDNSSILTETLPHEPLSNDLCGKQTVRADSLLSFLKMRNGLFVLPVFFMVPFRAATLNVLLQYTSVRFHWKISHVGILLSEVALVNIVLFLLLLPSLVTWVKNRYHVAPPIIDLTVARTSAILLSVGAVLLGLSPNVVLMIICTFLLLVSLT